MPRGGRRGPPGHQPGQDTARCAAGVPLHGMGHPLPHPAVPHCLRLRRVPGQRAHPEHHQPVHVPVPAARAGCHSGSGEPTARRAVDRRRVLPADHRGVPARRHRAHRVQHDRPLRARHAAGADLRLAPVPGAVGDLRCRRKHPRLSGGRPGGQRGRRVHGDLRAVRRVLPGRAAGRGGHDPDRRTDRDQPRAVVPARLQHQLVGAPGRAGDRGRAGSRVRLRQGPPGLDPHPGRAGPVRGLRPRRGAQDRSHRTGRITHPAHRRRRPAIGRHPRTAGRPAPGP